MSKPTIIPVSYSRAATYSEERRVYVDAHEYAAWCHDNGHESADLDSLRTYILTEYCGDIDEGEGDFEESEFSDFENAAYADILTAAAARPKVGRTDEELHDIAVQEVLNYGSVGRPMGRVATEFVLSESDQERLAALLMGASVSVTV